MRSPKTREKCTGRLRMFFDFIDILPRETMIERSKAFCDRLKSNNGWAFSCIVQYLQMLKERVEGKGNKRRHHEESISGCKVVL